MVAAEQGNLEIVQELIRRGANVNLDDVVRAHPYTHTHTQNQPRCLPLQVHVFVHPCGHRCTNNAVIVTTSSTGQVGLWPDEWP